MIDRRSSSSNRTEQLEKGAPLLLLMLRYDHDYAAFAL